MSAVVVVGAQWGDEGKGKVVDLYARHADQVVRYGGGANAGHTLVVDGEQLVFHLLPSGSLHPGKQCVLGQGTVVDPVVLLKEVDVLRARGLFDPARFIVSERAFLVLPHHMQIDALRDGRAGSLGTTRRGIGPAYEDKVGRRGLRIGDLFNREKFVAKLEANLEAWAPVIEHLGGDLPSAAGIVSAYMEHASRLAPMVGDAEDAVRRALDQGKRVLLEGAQGALLDIDTGTYPFVTSSSTVAGGATIGAGIGPTRISAVVGIAKAYQTRVGVGPFPTEMIGQDGAALREAGAEYGATTGRPRRCGWLDLVALRYAARTNSLSGLALTKIDVLTGMDEILVCTEYEHRGKRISTPPYDELDLVRPVYESHPGWREPLGGCRKLADLPENARRYVERIEALVECPIWLVSVGADREETILLRDPFA